jgi:hypothetical protein
MKTYALFALAVLAVAAQAQVTATPFFAAPPPLRHNFDANIATGYTTLPVFTGIGTATAMGPGSMMVMPDPSFVSPPHVFVGRNADIEIKVAVPMRRFGGFFNSGYFGLFSGFANFRFYDAANNPIGSASVALTPTMQWVGFKTIPKWKRVEITGVIAGFPGIVGMDSLRIRPN